MVSNSECNANLNRNCINNHGSLVPSKLSAEFETIPIGDENPPIQTQVEKIADKGSVGWRRYIGIVLILLSCMSLSFMAVVVKILKERYHPIMLTTWRYAGTGIPAIPVLIYLHFWGQDAIFDPIWPLFKTKDPERFKNVFGMLLRAGIGGFATICRFSSIAYLTLADVSVITQATPVFVFILARIFLGEKFSVVAIIAGFLSFLGIAVLSKPPFLTGQTEFSTNTLIGLALAVGALLISSSTLIIGRTLRKLNFALLLVVYGLVGLGETSCISIGLGVYRFPEGTRDILLTALLTTLAFAGQSLAILAIKYESAGTVSVLETSHVVYSFLWEIALLHVFPDYLSVMGAALVLSAILLISAKKWILTMPSESVLRGKLLFLTK